MIELPQQLLNEIDILCEGLGVNKITSAAEQLSLRYRQQTATQGLFAKNHLDYLAYAIFRMPATMSALESVLKELITKAEGSIQSVCDYGSGLASSVWVLLEQLASLQTVDCIEQSVEAIQLAKKLTASLQSQLNIRWHAGNYCELEPLHCDLALLSYTIGELSSKECLQILPKIWEKCSFMLIIEPGTPKGYARIMEARTQLLSLGAHMVAPCPHEKKCPMQGSDWCHFFVRLPRTQMHKLIKKGALGYEDEKFSYLIVSKEFYALQGSRIVRHPEIHKGHMKFQLCTDEGLKEQTVSKKEGDYYKQAKKLDWGDLIN